jgi:threonine synthase
MENDASQFDLLGQLRLLIMQRNEAAEAFDIFKQDAAMRPVPDMPVGEASSGEAAAFAAKEVDTFTAQTEGLMASATDDELLAAYQQTEGEVGDLAAETLLDEMRRRNLDE